MKKKDIYVYLSIFVLITAALSFRLIGQKSNSKNDYVTISYKDKKQVYEIKDKPYTVTVDQGNNMINKIHIEKDNVFMEESTCKNQLCIMQGKMTPGNIKSRPNGRYIICLPHKLTVELTLGDKDK